MKIRNIFKKRQQTTPFELHFQEYENIHQQYEQVSRIQQWLSGYTCETPNFNPYFFRIFFKSVRDLPFNDVPAEANSSLFYFDDSSKQYGTIVLPWEEASKEYYRLRAIDYYMESFESLVNPNQTTNTYLQSIHWARQTSQKLRIYLDSKEKTLKERLDTLMLELFPA